MTAPFEAPFELRRLSGRRVATLSCDRVKGRAVWRLFFVGGSELWWTSEEPTLFVPGALDGALGGAPALVFPGNVQSGAERCKLEGMPHPSETLKKTPEEIQARVRELAERVYDAADPTPDSAVFGFSALTHAFVTYCKVHGLTLEKAVFAVQSTWPLSGEPQGTSAAGKPSNGKGQ